jgi:hypothetical protein
MQHEDYRVGTVLSVNCYPLLDAAELHKTLVIDRTGIRDVLGRSWDGADEKRENNCQRESFADSHTCSFAVSWGNTRVQADRFPGMWPCDEESTAGSPVLLALVVLPIGSALSVAAQRDTPAAGPIALSINREAARLATVQQGQPDDPEWSRVRTLAPGTELIVIVNASQLARRYFVAGDESSLTVLNVGAPALPVAARDVLRDLASTHPAYFSAAQKGGQFALDRNVRVGPDGVFVADRKVADLAQVVEQYGRHDITEVTTAMAESNPVGCALAGYFGGAIIGGLPGAAVGGAVGRDTGPALLGMMVGWSLGAVYVYRKCRHQPEKVIYSR